MSEEKTSITSESLASKALVKAQKVYDNLGRELIMTTEDKVRLCMREHLQNMKERRAWVTPLGILITVIVALVTTEFQDVGFNASTWQAIFVIVGILAAIWLVKTIIQMPKSKTVEDIVRELKKAQQSEMAASG